MPNWGDNHHKQVIAYLTLERFGCKNVVNHCDLNNLEGGPAKLGARTR